MRNQPETLHAYSIPRLHWWFLITSLLFLGCVGLMVWIDYSGGALPMLALHGDREWKNFQSEFFTLEKERLATDAHAAELRANEEGLTKLIAERAEAVKKLESKRAEENAAQAAVEKAKVEKFIVTRDFTMQKASRDQLRSSYEGAVERNGGNVSAPEVRDWQRQVKGQNETVEQLDLDKQSAEAKLNEVQAKLDTIIGQREKLDADIKRQEASIGLLTKRLKQMTDPLVQAVVTAPLLEFAASPYQVGQIVAEKHHVDVNFVTVPRVDRCVTCHKSIDRKPLTAEEAAWREKHKIKSIDWAKLPEPLRSHPKLDLFVSDTSPHPMSTYGCTTCHWGWDRETNFARAGHTPDAEERVPYAFDTVAQQWMPVAEGDEDDKPAAKKDSKPQPVIEKLTQKVVWERNRNWQEQEFLLQPMRAKQYVQASCLKCHAAETNVTGAEKLDQGRRLIEQLGCWSCHKMKQLETTMTHKVQLGEDFEGICKFYDVDADEVRRINTLPADAVLPVGKELTIPIRTLRKPGPSLYKLASKTTKDWTRKWLDNPVAFKPNTYMPRFWGLENNKNTPERNALEQNAITEFLFAVSEQPNYPAPPAGDAANGQKIIGQLGCFACHVVDEKLTGLKPTGQAAKYVDAVQYRRLRSQGPQLAGTGSKTGPNWLFAWLKNPKQYNPHTKMPNLRLSDAEAADVAAYLATLRHEATDKQALPPLEAHRLDEVTLEYLQVTMPYDEAAQKLKSGEFDKLIELYFIDDDLKPYHLDPTRLAAMEKQQQALAKKGEEEFDDDVKAQAAKLGKQVADIKARLAAAVAGLNAKLGAMDATQKKNVFLGAKLIARYGCFACHNIRGFENAKPIGAELTEWGSKPISKLDFGLLELEHERIAWLKQKLGAPRSFDLGRIGVTRQPQELLKMGKFNLSPEQIDEIVTVISGMTDEKLTPQEARQLTPAEFNIERGRWLVKELNCIGCHIVENRGGAIRATITTPGMEPPMLSGTPTELQQGQRTQSDWLFGFLKQPQTGEIRPWLKARMPTFALTDSEANVLVRYFALAGRTRYPYETPKVAPTPENLAAGKELFTKLQCANCHIVAGIAKGKPLAEVPEDQLADLAPPLNLAHKRLQRDWLVNKWLVNPGTVIPGVKMPQFQWGTDTTSSTILGGDARKQVEAVADYVLSLGATPSTEAKQR